jgi:hypothetical protein
MAPYTFSSFTLDNGGVEQVFRPAVKLINPPALAAEVHRARIHQALKGIATQRFAGRLV